MSADIRVIEAVEKLQGKELPVAHCQKCGKLLERIETKAINYDRTTGKPNLELTMACRGKFLIGMRGHDILIYRKYNYSDRWELHRDLQKKRQNENRI